MQIQVNRSIIGSQVLVTLSLKINYASASRRAIDRLAPLVPSLSLSPSALLSIQLNCVSDSHTHTQRPRYPLSP